MIETTPGVTIVTGDLEAQLLRASYKEGRVAVDIETSGLDWKTDVIGTIQVYIPNHGTVIVKVSDQRPRGLLELFSAPQVTKVFHHALFDLRFIASNWNIRPANIADTKVASRILNPRLDHHDHSLAPLVWRHFGIKLDKAVRLSNWLSNELSPEQVAYAANDVRYLLPLLEKLIETATKEGVADLIEDSFAYIPTRIATDLRECGDVFSY